MTNIIHKIKKCNHHKFRIAQFRALDQILIKIVKIRIFSSCLNLLSRSGAISCTTAEHSI